MQRKILRKSLYRLKLILKIDLERKKVESVIIVAKLDTSSQNVKRENLTKRTGKRELKKIHPRMQVSLGWQANIEV